MSEALQVDTPRLGRPRLYTEELADRVCDLIASGRAINEFELKDGIPSQETIYRWVYSYPPFHDKYLRAREIQAEIHAQEIAKRAKEAIGLLKDCDPKKANAIVQAVRLEIDSFKWTAAKLLPKRYGDKLAVEHSIDATLAKRLEDAERNLLAAAHGPGLIDARAD